ncbi:MAG: nucleotidyltransferase family protein [Novosphingobium sp.]
MDTPALRRVLLELVGTAAQPDLAGLADTDWAQLDALAAEHRLQPLLHTRNPAGVPAAIRDTWRAAHRSAAMAALAQRADLVETVALLRAEGIEPLALKGAWLAHHAYPEPAQRPCRDIDLVVAEDRALEGYALLVEAGYALAENPEMSLADILRLEKHLPVLLAPRGTPLELHHRLWESAGRLDHAVPPLPAFAGLQARAWRDAEGIAYLGGGDMLRHLVVHAIYSHRLDCGPLVLSDLALTLAAAPADWPALWAAAEREGWAVGARLLFALVARYRPETAIDWTGIAPPPADLLAAAPDLLLQPLATRQSARFAAAWSRGPKALLGRARGKRGAVGETSARREMASSGGFIGWAWSRLTRTLGDLTRRETRRQARGLVRLGRWLGE